MATVELDERNGASPGTDTHNVANVNFGSADVAGLSPLTYPLTSGDGVHSYEKWLRLHVTAMGLSTVVDNIKVWLSNTGGGFKLGEGLSFNGRTVGYSAASYPSGGPVNTDSASAVNAIPQSEPTGANIGIGGALSGQLTAAGYSDWIVLQLDISGSTPVGDLNQKTLTFQWDEQ